MQSTWQTGVANARLMGSSILDFCTTMALKKHLIISQFQTKIIKIKWFQTEDTLEGHSNKEDETLLCPNTDHLPKNFLVV